MICIAIDNGSNNTVGGSYYSAHQAVRSVAFIEDARLSNNSEGLLLLDSNLSNNSEGLRNCTTF